MLLKLNSIYILGRLLPALISFAAITWFTHLVTPAQYGVYALVMVIATVANMGFFQWLRVSVLRLAPSETTDLKVLRSTALGGFCGLVLLSGVVGLLAWLVSRGQTSMMIAYAVPLTWAMAWSDLNLDWLRAQLAPWRYSALYMTRAVATVIVAGALASYGWGEVGLIIGAIVGAALPSLLFIRSCYAGVRVHLFDRALLRRMIRYGVPLAGTYVLTGLMSGMDRMLLGALGGASAVGVYAAASDIAKNSLYVLMQSVNLGAYPLAIRALEKEGMAVAQKQLRENATLMALISFPATAGLALVAPAIITQFLDARFHDTALMVFGTIAGATLLSGWRAFYLDQSFQLGHKTGPQLKIMGAAILISLGTNALLIPLFGALGAALSNVVTFAFVVLLTYWLGRQIFPLPIPWGEWMRIALATLAMSLALLPFHHATTLFALAAQISLGGMVYAISILALNVMNLRHKIMSKFLRLR